MMDSRTCSAPRPIGLVCVLVVILTLIGGVQLAGAQGVPATAIEIGQNVAGEISELNPRPTFGFLVDTPQVVDMQLFAITPGFSPAFRVIDPTGAVLQYVDNESAANVVRASLALSTPGFYTVELHSANGVPGQYFFSLQPGEPLQPPIPLQYGQLVAGGVAAEAPRVAFTFTGSPEDTLQLVVDSPVPDLSPVVRLLDADTGETLGISSARLIGASFRLPRGSGNYVLEVTHSGSLNAEEFTVCVGGESVLPACPETAAAAAAPTPTATAIPTATPVPLPPLPLTGPCIVASATGATVNVRSGPSTDYTIVTRLSGTQTLPVIGRLPDNSWFLVSLSGIPAWISTSVVRVGGECGLVAAVTPTPAPITATLTPTTTGTLAPPTDTPTATATTALTATPTATHTSTSTPTYTPTAVATLNFSLPPVFGSTSLTSGFVPDPFTVGVTGGGPANVSYLGGGCSGFATAAPSFSVNYTSGAFPLLRFYFIGGGDSTMIINTPGGNYVCADDSFGTLNPTIDFNSPASGRYDVWIASFAQGGSVSGTLYVTENSGNHP